MRAEPKAPPTTVLPKHNECSHKNATRNTRDKPKSNKDKLVKKKKIFKNFERTNKL